MKLENDKKKVKKTENRQKEAREISQKTCKMIEKLIEKSWKNRTEILEKTKDPISELENNT